MRDIMAHAAVGDDVYGEDPSVNALEAEAAERLGKETAVFFPSGTQSNLCAILCHCRRGDEMLVGTSYHTFGSEAGGASALGGVAYSPLPVREDGSIDVADVTSGIRVNDMHRARTRLLCLENTTDGRAVPLSKLHAVAEVARNHGLKIHLDGARLFNACIALHHDVKDFTALADTVSVCLSKGLGAPSGTVLATDEARRNDILRIRKMLGGGMRQIGIIAAAGLFALQSNISRLSDDHRRAELLAQALLDIAQEGDRLEVSQATNMVYVTPHPADHAKLHAHLAARGILIGNSQPAMRIVTHLGIADSDIAATADAFRSYFESD